MKEPQTHGTPMFPIAWYEWHGGIADVPMLNCHWHDQCEFFMIYNGMAYFTVDGVSNQINTGDLVFIPSGRMHMAEPVNDEPFYYRAVVFDAATLCESVEIARVKYITPMLEGKYHIKTIFSKDLDNGCTDAFDNLFITLFDTPPAYELISVGYLLKLLGYVFAASGESPEPIPYVSNIQIIKKVITYIEENFSETITVDKLCGLAGMSRGHFTKMFRRFTSKSPIDYVISIRLRHAAMILCERDDKLINIAIDTGFNNLSYFIRSFSEAFGCSPTEYRKMYYRRSV